MARFERTAEFQKQRFVHEKLMHFNVDSPSGFKFDSDAQREGKGGRKSKPKVCDIKSENRCAIQLRFKAGKAIIRACDGKKAFDFPAADPVNGQNISAALCKCKAKKGSFEACLEEATAAALACTTNKNGSGCWPGKSLKTTEALSGTRKRSKRRRLGSTYDLSTTISCSPAVAKRAKDKAWESYVRGYITQEKHNEIVSRANALCPKKKKRKR